MVAGGAWAPRVMRSLAGGVDLLVTGLLQGILSYPFFDPVGVGAGPRGAIGYCSAGAWH